jgi:drug/metabolite transporter (DMT)-like permease
VTIAFSAILVRLADLPPSTSAFYRCAYALPVLLALALWERGWFGPRDLRERGPHPRRRADREEGGDRRARAFVVRLDITSILVRAGGTGRRRVRV